MKRNRLILSFSLFFSFSFLLGCNFHPTPTPQKSVTLSESSISLNVGEEKLLTVSVSPKELEEKPVSWISNNSSVASVTDGKVLAISKGNAKIIATVEGMSAYCNVKVIGENPSDIKVEGISLNYSTLNLKVGDNSTQLVVSFIPDNASNKNYSISYSKENIVSVSSQGYVTALNEGDCLVTFTSDDGGFKTNCSINVSKGEDSLWDESQDYLRSGTKNLEFYNINDFHGAVERDSSWEINEPGMTYISSYFKQEKAKNPDGYVLTSSGDMWQGSADSNITKGRLVVEWMNYLNFDAQALGNHEFDWTINTIISNQQLSNFDYLACNIFYKNSSKPVEWAKPYTTITRNGVHIGIIGAIGAGQTRDILSSNVKDVTFVDPNPIAIEWADYLRDNGADVVIYLLHDSIERINNNTADCMDAIFGGHTHTGESDFLGSYSNIPAIQAYCNGKDIGHISIEYSFSSSKVSSREYEIVDLRPSKTKLSEDSGARAIYQEYLDNEISVIKDEVVSTYKNNIDRNEVPSIYNYYAYKYFKDNHDIENKYNIFAVETNGARSNIVSSSNGITYGAIYKSLPFDNHLHLVKIKGSDIVNKLSTYAASKYYVVGCEAMVQSNAICDYVTNLNAYYYMLMIDYISTSYSSNVIETIDMYNQEESLPRNIVKQYIGGYPNNYPF